ncbi:guanylate kinase [Mycoplasma flocculare]|uniref:Guanylate kinase n=2 Tax=Mesomycoplasma flocculare TaxID=2128 RepID=A0A0A8E7G2_MESFC|nr:guanylate kinase [Mesomycoplasma flocculare]MXR39430.1 guanylate kinase [Mycoplasma sp. MF12]AJC49958.1 guanylate kinase [Mesomycoplasma flocculare ATCC 27399]ENX50928.1 guanylate kinase [Mesomycoplasma flocculare ATCC 27716]MXR05839.1 guanylate kinase [Mesomycoplasma flocculare]MXR12251.1 guanylate kinase [Mesomycoplasma flocculare]
MSKLIILSGPSGVGKGTIEALLLKNKHLLIKLAISATTRKKRKNEIDGVNYFFLTEQMFKKKIENEEFIEWSRHFNNYYGTLKSQIEFIKSQNYIPLLEIDTTGAKNIIESYQKKGKLSELLTIFILPPSLEVLKNRIEKRLTETYVQINQRLEKAKSEIKIKNLFQFQVVNDNLEQCVNELEKIISKVVEKS